MYKEHYVFEDVKFLTSIKDSKYPKITMKKTDSNTNKNGDIVGICDIKDKQFPLVINKKKDIAFEFLIPICKKFNFEHFFMQSVTTFCDVSDTCSSKPSNNSETVQVRLHEFLQNEERTQKTFHFGKCLELTHNKPANKDPFRNETQTHHCMRDLQMEQHFVSNS